MIRDSMLGAPEPKLDRAQGCQELFRHGSMARGRGGGALQLEVIPFSWEYRSKKQPNLRSQRLVVGALGEGTSHEAPASRLPHVN